MGDPVLVSAAGEVRLEKSGDAGLRHVASNKARAERYHVRVIVFARERGRQGIADTSAATFEIAVDGNRDPDAAAADCDPALGFAESNIGPEFRAKFRIIDALGTICSKIGYIVTLFAQPLRKLVFEDVASMVGGKGDAHGG